MKCNCCQIEMDRTGGGTCFSSPSDRRGWQCPKCKIICLEEKPSMEPASYERVKEVFRQRFESDEE